MDFFADFSGFTLDEVNMDSGRDEIEENVAWSSCNACARADIMTCATILGGPSSGGYCEEVVVLSSFLISLFLSDYEKMFFVFRL